MNVITMTPFLLNIAFFLAGLKQIKRSAEFLNGKREDIQYIIQESEIDKDYKEILSKLDVFFAKNMTDDFKKCTEARIIAVLNEENNTQFRDELIDKIVNDIGKDVSIFQNDSSKKALTNRVGQILLPVKDGKITVRGICGIHEKYMMTRPFVDTLIYDAALVLDTIDVTGDLFLVGFKEIIKNNESKKEIPIELKKFESGFHSSARPWGSVKILPNNKSTGDSRPIFTSNPTIIINETTSQHRAAFMVFLKGESVYLNEAIREIYERNLFGSSGYSIQPTVPKHHITIIGRESHIFYLCDLGSFELEKQKDTIMTAYLNTLNLISEFNTFNEEKIKVLHVDLESIDANINIEPEKFAKNAEIFGDKFNLERVNFIFTPNALDTNVIFEEIRDQFKRNIETRPQETVSIYDLEKRKNLINEHRDLLFKKYFYIEPIQ